MCLDFSEFHKEWAEKVLSSLSLNLNETQLMGFLHLCRVEFGHVGRSETSYRCYRRVETRSHSFLQSILEFSSSCLSPYLPFFPSMCACCAVLDCSSCFFVSSLGYFVSNSHFDIRSSPSSRSRGETRNSFVYFQRHNSSVREPFTPTIDGSFPHYFFGIIDRFDPQLFQHQRLLWMKCQVRDVLW